VRDRKIDTNVLLSKEEEREQMLLIRGGQARGRSDGVIFSLLRDPARATIAPGGDTGRDVLG
jgi:hypothetical protein